VGRTKKACHPWEGVCRVFRLKVLSRPWRSLSFSGDIPQSRAVSRRAQAFVNHPDSVRHTLPVLEVARSEDHPATGAVYFVPCLRFGLVFSLGRERYNRPWGVSKRPAVANCSHGALANGHRWLEWVFGVTDRFAGEVTGQAGRPLASCCFRPLGENVNRK
jgi:hypothetical protein